MTNKYQNNIPELTAHEFRKKYSEEFEQGAQNLADEIGRPIEEVRLGLEGLGFRGALFRKNTVLAVASLCASRFQYFETKFPNLKTVIDDMLVGADLGRQQNDQSVLTIPLKIPMLKVREDHRGGSLFPVVQQIADLFTDIYGQTALGGDQREVVLDIAAWKWLQFCVLMRHRKQYPALTREFLKAGKNIVSIAENITGWAAISSGEDFALNEGYLVHGPEKWIQQYFSLLRKSGSIRLMKINLCIEASIHEFSTVEPENTKSAKAIKKSTKSHQPLSERQLLKSDWYYPTPTEEKSIRKFFRKNLKDKGVHKDEALILALSIATCRDVRDVLMLPFGWNDGIDAIVFKEIEDGFHTTEFAVWRKSEHANADSFAELQLVEKITDILRPHLPSQGARKVHEVVHP